MEMCAEGGEGEDIEYISPSDNRVPTAGYRIS